MTLHSLAINAVPAMLPEDMDGAKLVHYCVWGVILFFAGLFMLAMILGFTIPNEKDESNDDEQNEQ